MELVIDTATRYASVAVSRDGAIVAELSWRSERNHSVELVPAIRRVVEQASVTLDDAEAVFVVQGPGGFSALRVGISMAKAFAMARDIPLVGVNTLDAEAQPYLGMGLPVCAVVGAGKTRVYSALVRGRGDSSGYRVQSHEELANGITEKTLLCGEGLPEVGALVEERAGDLAVMAGAPPPTRRPAVLAQLGYELLQGGGAQSPESLEPIYMRAAQIAAAQRNRKE